MSTLQKLAYRGIPAEVKKELKNPENIDKFVREIEVVNMLQKEYTQKDRDLFKKWKLSTSALKILTKMDLYFHYIKSNLLNPKYTGDSVEVWHKFVEDLENGNRFKDPDYHKGIEHKKRESFTPVSGSSSPDGDFPFNIRQCFVLSKSHITAKKQARVDHQESDFITSLIKLNLTRKIIIGYIPLRIILKYLKPSFLIIVAVMVSSDGCHRQVLHVISLE